jgi:hypothetical protein
MFPSSTNWIWLSSGYICRSVSLSQVLFALLLILRSSGKSLGVRDASCFSLLTLTLRLSICITNPCCNPMIDANHHTHCLTKIYLLSLANDNVLQRVYNNIVVVFESNHHVNRSGISGVILIIKCWASTAQS